MHTTRMHAYIDIYIDIQQVVPVGGGYWRLIAVTSGEQEHPCQYKNREATCKSSFISSNL